MVRRLSVAERLAKYSHYDPMTGCRLWRGKSGARQYGRIWVDGKMVLAHRAAWKEVNGPIPDGLCCLHNCPAGDNSACIEVAHLFLGTDADNNADMHAKGRWRKADNRGSKHGLAKLTERQVIALRADHRLYREIAADYDVSLSTVSLVKSGKTWKHVA